MRKKEGIKRLKRFFCLFLLVLLSGWTTVQGQNVKVKPSSGSMIASVPENISGSSGDYDTFFSRGGFATWRHNQLCLTLTTSDAPDLTDNGLLANPANNLYGRTSTDEIEMGRGGNEATRNCYMNLALPRGFRFTGYQIVFSRNRSDFGNNGTSDNPNTGGTTRFGETDENFTYMTGQYRDITYNANATLENESYTLTKEDATGMSNNLYFRLTDANTGTGRMVVTFHSITLYFTAEEDYTPVMPQSTIASPVSAVDIPFATGKVDYGTIQNRNYNGISRVSYSSANIIDMSANMVLYEAESVKNGTNFDETSGKVVDYKSGSIRNIQDYFVVGKSGAEQVYFIETPTYVTLPDANKTKNPVGYRIVEAELEYKYGTPQSESVITKYHYYITYQSSGTTYYLNSEGHFVTGTQTEWERDDDGYVHCGDIYLVCTSGNHNLALGTVTSSRRVKVDSSNRIYYTGGNTYYLKGTTSATATPVFQNSNSNTAAWTTDITQTTVPAYTPAPFTLYVYDKDGSLKTTRQVNSSADDGTVKITRMNNDAVKFGVKGIGLIKGTLTIQALDPYIDRMNVVCQDKEQPAIRITETFEVNDFSMNDGEFFFYLPADRVGKKVKISYEELWSHYADETYAGGSEQHNSRFSFVNSAHYNKFTNDNVYSDTAEAAAGASTVSDRLSTDKVGSVAFRFNNVAEVGVSGGTVTEYPFTKANYAAAPNNGLFQTMEFTVSAADQQDVAYVFTTDETRYNIAPTTAVQHRTYAFYKMIIHVQSGTYMPKVQIVKLYANSCVEENREPVNKPYYGAIVTANIGNSTDPGFASDLEVEQTIDQVISRGYDSFSNSDVPQSAKQILYVDLSGLAGYYTNSEAAMTLSQYKNQKLATNALVFLPKGVTTTDDNFAFMTDGLFRAANNIIITDKQPFFSPYDIQVPSQNYATYKRLASANGNQLVKYATIIMPFSLKVTEGHHKNDTEDAFEFDLRTLTSIRVNDDVSNHYGDAAFNLIDGIWTEPNKPYMVEVTSANGSDYSFIASQKGSNINATVGIDDPSKIEGETVHLNSGGTFKNIGTYSGVSVPKGENIFYFNKDKYVSSLSLSDRYTHVYVQPFRAYFATSGLSASAKGMDYFSILYDIMDEEGGTPTAIAPVNGQQGLKITTGRGTMLLTATENIGVDIRNVNGSRVTQTTMRNGEQHLLNLPAGIYIVNNTKVIVK